MPARTRTRAAAVGILIQYTQSSINVDFYSVNSMTWIRCNLTKSNLSCSYLRPYKLGPFIFHRRRERPIKDPLRFMSCSDSPWKCELFTGRDCKVISFSLSLSRTDFIVVSTEPVKLSPCGIKKNRHKYLKLNPLKLMSNVPKRTKMDTKPKFTPPNQKSYLGHLTGRAEDNTLK
jgi:hypothetical protein